MRLDKERLKATIAANGQSYQKLADGLNIGIHTLCRHINSNKLTLPELWFIAERLKLQGKDIVEIFFGEVIA